MSRKQRKAAKRRAIRKARAGTFAKFKSKWNSLGVPLDSICSSCKKQRGEEFGWRQVFDKDGPASTYCPACIPETQVENYTWDDWDDT